MCYYANSVIYAKAAGTKKEVPPRLFPRTESGFIHPDQYFKVQFFKVVFCSQAVKMRFGLFLFRRLFSGKEAGDDRRAH